MLPLNLISEKMQKLDNWSLEEHSIVKDYSFNSFKEALNFVNKIGEIAERINHHPDILISYNKVRLTLTTHSERTLTLKDFELAEEIDKIKM